MAWFRPKARSRIALDPETTRLLWPLVAEDLRSRRRRQRQRGALVAVGVVLFLMMLFLAGWQDGSITWGRS